MGLAPIHVHRHRLRSHLISTRAPRYARDNCTDFIVHCSLFIVHCSGSSTSSTVTVRLVTFCSPKLLPATTDPELTASFLSGTLPKLQLDASELGSATSGDELACGPVADGPGAVEADAEDSGTDGLDAEEPVIVDELGGSLEVPAPGEA